MKKSLFTLGAMGIISLVMLSSCATTKNSAKNSANDKTSDSFLAELTGTYEELFPAWRAEKYNSMWENAFAKYADVPAHLVPEVKDIFLSAYESSVYGFEAEALAVSDPNYYAFDCGFTNGVTEFKFDGNKISGIGKDGKEIFSRTYTFVDSVKADFGAKTEAYAAYLSEEDWPSFAIYEAKGAVDEFKYFALGGDTPAETFHIEFRYGNDKDELVRYFNGKYAYWMASGVFKDADIKMMNNVIDLFAKENADTIKAIAASLSE